MMQPSIGAMALPPPDSPLTCHRLDEGVGATQAPAMPVVAGRSEQLDVVAGHTEAPGA